ncbi:MAG: LysM peptidoglycan-binding domain-containing protein [Aggregatilineales bacterium]
MFNPELLETQHIHIVEQGETLSSIATTYNLFTETLASANHIHDTHDIWAGEWLFIPEHPTRAEILTVAIAGLIALLTGGILPVYLKFMRISQQPKNE